MRALGKFLIILAAAGGVGAFADAVKADMPKNMIFFVPGGECPKGTSRAADANGRMLLVANDPGAVGRTYETPLRDKEDRKNHAVAHVSVNLREHSISGASSWAPCLRNHDCCDLRRGQSGEAAKRFACPAFRPL